MKANRLSALWICLIVFVAQAAAHEIRVSSLDQSERAAFGMKRLASAVEARDGKLVHVEFSKQSPPDVVVVTGRENAKRIAPEAELPASIAVEGFALVNASLSNQPTLMLVGGDSRGTMYGLLDLADQYRAHGLAQRISERQAAPRFPFRAIKFNLPWMPYRTGKALEQHVETCRDLTFWEAFLDMMAENRFNTLTLWNLHPFETMIRPKNFPEACGLNDSDLAEWQTFWRRLFAMANDRGIDVYLVNWNIFVSPALAKARGVATYSADMGYFGEGDTSELVQRYTRECVTQVIDEYEGLSGLGITLGERMGGMTTDERRAWLDRTFIAGMKAAKRPVKFIYRAPLSADKGSGGSTSDENDRKTRAHIESLDMSTPVWVEFKYNWSHGHSSPRLHIVHGGKLTDAYFEPRPEKHRVVWTVRNEDFFVLRWGSARFIREFIENNGQPYVGGCLVGSECYIPAKDYITRPGPHKTWNYAFERQWLYYRLWGRLLYDPKTPDDALVATCTADAVDSRAAEQLYQAWATASEAPLLLASFFRGTWDATLYSEGFCTVGAKFIGVDALIKQPVLDDRYCSIRDFIADPPSAKGEITPLQLAERLDQNAAAVLAMAADLAANGALPPAVVCELADLEAWAWHMRYFADKLRGGVALARFRRTGEKAQQDEAIAALTRAAEHWEKLTEAVTRFNHATIPYVFDEKFSWKALSAGVTQDIETARNAKPDEAG